MEITLEMLGLTKEEMQARVIDAAVRTIMEETGYDPETGEFSDDSKIVKKLRVQITTRIDRQVERIGRENVDPIIGKMIEGYVLQQTNEWGEKKGAPVTFVEYLVKRAEAYATAEVDSEGKSKDENRYGSSWSGTKTTRLMHAINKHLAFHINGAMREALSAANATLAKGIEDGIKVQLAALLAGLKVSAEVER